MTDPNNALIPYDSLPMRHATSLRDGVSARDLVELGFTDEPRPTPSLRELLGLRKLMMMPR